MSAIVELNERQLAFVAECEKQFADRFKQGDPDYEAACENDNNNTPPIFTPWEPRRRRNFERRRRSRSRSRSRSPRDGHHERRRDNWRDDRRRNYGREERRHDSYGDRNRHDDNRHRGRDYHDRRYGRDNRGHDQGGSWQGGRSNYGERRQNH